MDFKFHKKVIRTISFLGGPLNETIVLVGNEIWDPSWKSGQSNLFLSSIENHESTFSGPAS